MSESASTEEGENGHAARAGEHDLETLGAFLDQARTLAEWHRQRSAAFESRAATILGFAGVTLTLSTLAAGPIARVEGDHRAVLVGLMIGVGLCLLVSAVMAVMALQPRGYLYASRQQLRREWETYRDEPARPTEEVVGMLADQLICGSEESPIDTLADTADSRGTLVHRSIIALLIGLILLVVVATTLLLEVPR